MKINDNFESLPAGHYDRIDAEKALKIEYNDAHAIERSWGKKMHMYTSFSPENAIEFINNVAFNLGEKRKIVREIVLDAANMTPWAAASYNRWGKAIYFKHRWISLGVLIHEGTHYFASGHDRKFCEYLELMMESAYNEWRANLDKYVEI